MISFEKALKLLDEKGYSTYRLRREKILGEKTLTNMRKGASDEGGGIDSKVINRLCRILDCQPGDLMEYRP
ncbi:helix-turn-helix transcriptional regulator [Eubacteriales bacterium OttesenSCG-928-A19]|nr:helix-turn-helix transcriptional regulator [Eubacteriales bacterium OttesenSCG-928-A19]